MFCGSCGKFIEEGSKFCTGCGKKVTPIGSNTIQESASVTTNPDPINTGNNSNYNINTNCQDDVVCQTQDKANIWLVIVGFLIPLIGLILFISLKQKTPKKANAIGIAALIGFIIGAFVLPIIAIIFMVANVSTEFNDYYDYYDEYYDDDYYYYEDYEYDFEEEFDKLEDKINKYYEENTI